MPRLKLYYDEPALIVQTNILSSTYSVPAPPSAPARPVLFRTNERRIDPEKEQKRKKEKQEKIGTSWKEDWPGGGCCR